LEEEERTREWTGRTKHGETYFSCLLLLLLRLIIDGRKGRREGKRGTCGRPP